MGISNWNSSHQEKSVTRLLEDVLAVPLSVRNQLEALGPSRELTASGQRDITYKEMFTLGALTYCFSAESSGPCA